MGNTSAELVSEDMEDAVQQAERHTQRKVQIFDTASLNGGSIEQ